jgi:hypothetical protein
VGSVFGSGAPTLVAGRARDESARARICRGLRAAMHALRDWARLVGVALPCSPPAGSDFGAAAPWQHGAGGVTVTTRVCSGFASMAEVGARCPAFEEQVRSWPCSFRGRLAERLRPIGERHGGPSRQREGGSALGRSSPVEGTPRPQAHARRSRGKHGKAAWGLGGGPRRKAGHPRRNQERQRLVGHTPFRSRTPERRAHRGSKRVKRREPRHPPGLGRARGIDADPGC